MVTAIEIVPEIAQIYQDFFPNDKVIVADAHQYLLEHFKEFDFIWSSPPCPSHSQYRKRIGVDVKGFKPVFPDMRLYEEIIFLQHYFRGKWVVENVKPYYKPLIEPQIIQRHFLWANFNIPKIKIEGDGIRYLHQIKLLEKHNGFEISKYNVKRKDQILRNCVNSQLGLHIFKMAFEEPQLTLEGGANYGKETNYQ